MNTTEMLLVVTALAILAETTYLVVKLPRQTSKKAGSSILVDTSVLIDGRIIAVAKSGFIGGTLIIPRSVIGELQFLADNADHEKRARARHGLDIVTELQNMPQVNVEILQDGSKAEEGVDERLLKLAKKSGAAICTIDYNLNKVAVVEGIMVVNVNELAQSLRMAYLPGERLRLELVQKGQDSHQAVGYLGDGTMVVVEHASKFLGKIMEVEFIRSLQTAAGKMMFARLVEQRETPVPARTNKPSGKKPVRTQRQEEQQQQSVPKVVQAPSQPQQPPHVVESDRPPLPKRTPRPQPQQKQNRRSTKPSRTQKDREAALIDLVDKQ